jgi:Mce-associated membrane protein
MSTTRHLINRRRRTAPPVEESPAAGRRPAPAAVRARTRPRPAGRPAEPAGKQSPAPARPPRRGRAEPAGARDRDAGSATPPRGGRLAAALGAAAVLLGCFAAFAAGQASGGDDPAAENAALVDAALTSEVKGGVGGAVEAVFSVDYTDPGENEKAARTYLTGEAVEQHRRMLGDVRKQAPSQKLVLTTTVTDSAVELAGDDAARVLVFADQRNTRTDTDETSYGAAMVAVDAVKDGGRWRISNIDTFG